MISPRVQLGDVASWASITNKAYRVRFFHQCVIALAISGCATVTVRDDGSAVFMGCGKVETLPFIPYKQGKGEFLDIRVAGILMFASPNAAGISIGLSHDRTIILGDDAKVILYSNVGNNK